MNKPSNWLKNNKMLGFALVLLFCAAAGAVLYLASKNPVASGAAAARKDFRNGVYMLRGHGLPDGCAIAYRELLAERFNIKLYNQGCLVGLGEKEFDEAYNLVATDLLIKHFGRDIFAETRHDACVLNISPKN